MTNPLPIQQIKAYLLDLQNHICDVFQSEDGQTTFKEDAWEHRAGFYGVSRVLTNGLVFEKAGVNFSHVRGAELPVAATNKRPELKNASFEAIGVSVVAHPLNPFAPTSHLNVRFITVQNESMQKWWFGGGYDLTPYYGFEEDCIHWHQTAKNACEPFGQDVYPKLKKWCDDYFFLKHRNEPRGIGGLFFDDLNQWSFEQCFEFMQSIGNSYTKAYQPILNRRKTHAYGESEKMFQHYRRGRYVEFNLLYDRGTLFGLQSNGRIESILMSLPPQVAFTYDYQPTPFTKEAELYEKYLINKEWVS